MNEQGLTPRKYSPSEIAALLKGIKLVADSERPAEDPLSLVGEEDLEKERIVAAIERIREESRQTKFLFNARIILLVALFTLIVAWLVSVMMLTALCGLHLWGFALSDKVIMTYITSTTVSVLGLFHIAARWLFSLKESSNRVTLRDPPARKANQ
jgi:hypothetical protein